MNEVGQRTAVGLRFTVLRGGVGVEVDGEPASLGGPMQRRLLAALLAEHGATVSADRLVEWIWAADAAPDGARRTVMSYVSRLRSVIGADHLVTRDTGYQLLLDGAAYDADEFELALAEARAVGSTESAATYDRALALWSGRAFGDEADEWWLQPVAARLEELRLVAQEERAEVLLAEGRHAEAVADLEALCAQQPLRERFVELLMRALYLGGRQAEALRAYQRFRDYLGDETGLVPSDELADLEHRITVGDPSVAPASGVAVPGYELGEVIGVGAFGAVYQAVQPSVGREVAIKVVQPELADDPQFVQRFEAEAQLVARIEHPHVVPLYDYWRRPGGAFLVFRLLRGGTLADRIAGGPLPLHEVARIVEEMSGALDAAHALGVVHRDVKPANVLFDEAGNSYLADFGIAVDADLDLDIDHELRTAGSPMYASPEQARDGVATAASDQYALAVVAWEALTAAAPFEGASTTEVLRTKFHSTVPALRGAGELPDALNTVLQRATAPNPADRFGSVRAFAEAWRAAVVATSGPGRTTGELGRATPPPRSATATMAALPTVGANPYKGLRAFREADAAEFYGRRALVERLAEVVAEAPFVAVVGPSGSGKSSLVHAGVIPLLRRRGALVASMVPGSDPLVELEAALRRVATLDDETAIGARLRTPGGLAAIATELVEPGGELVLVVDQFEELFTLVRSEGERDRFADLVVRGATGAGPLRIIATLRADLYDRPLQHPSLGALVSESTFALTPLSPAELAEAVERPAEAAGVRFEPGLVATLVNDVGSRPGALPLLQFTLTELFELRTNATITSRAYDELGGLGGALANRAEHLYAELDDDLRDDVRRLFLQLVAPGDGTEDLRRRATPPELQGIDRGVVDRYRENRLLVTDHHPITREPTLEVAHEALLREWPRLRGWIDGAQGAIRQRRTLEVDAAAWDQQGRDPSGLLRGTRLVAATELAHDAPLTTVEREYVAASEALADGERAEAAERLARQQRQNRRLRRLVAGVAVALVVAVIAGVLALDQRGAARDAAGAADRNAAQSEVRRLVAEAERYAPTNADLAMLLAAEAARRQPGAQTADALATALLTDPDLVRIQGDANRPRPTLASGLPGSWPAFSPDSTQLAIPDPAARDIRVVDVLTGKVVRRLALPTFDGDAKVAGLTWSTPGTIGLRTDHSVASIDARTGTVRLAPTAVPGVIGDAAISADGRRLAVVSSDPKAGQASLTVIDTATDAVHTAPMPCCRQAATLGVGRIRQTLSGTVAWRGNELYVGSGSGTLQRRDPATAKALDTIPLSLPWLYRMTFSRDGRRLITSGQQAKGPDERGDPVGVLQAYDTATWAPLWTKPPNITGLVVDDPSHDAVRAVNIWSGGDIVTIARDTGEVAGRSFRPPNGAPCQTLLSPDARFLVSAPCSKAALTIWSLGGDGAIMRKVGPGIGDAPLITINRDGTHAVVTVDVGAAYDMDLRAGTSTLLPGLAGAVYLTDGRLTLLRPDGTPGVSRRPVDDPAKPFAVDWGTAPIEAGNAVDSLPATDINALSARDNRTVHVYRGFDLIATTRTTQANISSFVLTRDGERLLLGTVAGEVEVYRLDDPEHPHPAGFEAARFATGASKRLLAVSEPDGSIVFRDGATFHRTGGTIEGAPGSPALTLTPDDRTLLVSSGTDSALRLYDVESASQLGPKLTVDQWWTAVTPSLDNSFALVWRSGSLVELSLDHHDWLEAACRAAGRNLTKAEWAEHIGGPPRATCPQWPAPR